MRNGLSYAANCWHVPLPTIRLRRAGQRRAGAWPGPAAWGCGISGYVAAEYVPTTTTTESLGRFRHPEGDRP